MLKKMRGKNIIEFSPRIFLYLGFNTNPKNG